MKILLAPAALILLATSTFADVIIETKIESPQMNTTMTTKIKGGKLRTDLTGPMGAMSSILDSATGASIQLMHGQKMAMKTSAEQMKQAMEMAKKASGVTADPAAKPAKLVATGQKEKVGEYECEIYTWSGNGMENRYWVALKHPQTDLIKQSEKLFKNSALNSAGGPDLTELPGPVLKTEMNAAGMKTVTTVLSVKEANVNASEFEVPKDYQDLSSLGGAGVPAAK